MGVYKIISAPEGQPTFEDESGNVRQFLRITEGEFPNENEAKRHVDAANYAVYQEHGGLLYEIMSVEEIV